MRGLTISQPFASLIARGEKWVENRRWECQYRGLLAIHAGKGRQYLDRSELATYPTGCIVAVARVIGCVDVALARRAVGYGQGSLSAEQVQAAVNHKHTEGPWGIVLGDIIALDDPIPWSGSLGLWHVRGKLLDTLTAAHRVGF